MLRSSPRERLLTRPLAITSIATSDIENARSVDSKSFFRWGVGPSLLRGSIVAMYVPKTARQFEPSERGIRHVFSVVRDTIPAEGEFEWRNVVFLNNCTTLANTITFEDLQGLSARKWRSPPKHFQNLKRYLQNAGRARDPLTFEEAEAFWSLVLRKNRNQQDDLADNLVTPTDLQLGKSRGESFDYDVAISYASEDRPLALKIASACKRKNLTTFMDTLKTAELAGKDLVGELSRIYQTKAQLFVPVVTAAYLRKCWTSYEAQLAFARAMVDSFGFIVPVTTHDLILPRFGRNVVYIDLRKTKLCDLANTLKDKLTME
ncbi:MAG: TIR domain-containing protein [Candidatus Hodarchaeota archaeon]